MRGNCDGKEGQGERRVERIQVDNRCQEGIRRGKKFSYGNKKKDWKREEWEA